MALEPTAVYAIVPPEEDEDDGRAIMAMFVKELRRRLKEQPKDISAAEMTVILRLLADNSVSLQSVRRGDFGTVAQNAAENFPFPEGPSLQ